MREIDIIKEDIRCCDDFDVYPNDSINITYEMWTNISEHILVNHLVGSISILSIIRTEGSQQCTK